MILDLLVVLFIQGFLVKPMQVFGLGGLVSGFAGLIICAWLAFERIAFGAPLAERPLLLFGVLLIIVGVQLASIGLVADLLTRTYHESQGKTTYRIRRKIGGSAAETSSPSGNRGD